MNTLAASSGIVATLAQNAAQTPFRCRYCLDIRDIERCHGCASLFQERADRAQRLRSREVADDRHDQVLALQRLHDAKLVSFAR